MSANPSCERLNKKPRRAEEVIVNANGTLRNTFIRIKSGLPTARWEAPVELAKLDQVGCVYEPHVLALMVGQTLEISNSDTVNHNIHANAKVNEAWNVTEPPRAEKRREKFDKEEILFPVTCGVHPWMRSYLAVVSHPFFAVTGDDGSFTLKGLPPGTYTVEAVHEKYGKKEMQIVIIARESKELDFQFAAEASNN
jgi:plastocyanin